MKRKKIEVAKYTRSKCYNINIIRLQLTKSHTHMKLIGGWRGCPFLKSFYITKYKENAEILLVKKGKKKIFKNIVKQLVCLRIISFT